MSQPPVVTGFEPAKDLVDSLLMELPQALACVDADGRILYCNRQFCDQVKECGQDLSLGSLSELFTSIDSGRWARLYEMLEQDLAVVSNERLGVDAGTAMAMEVSLQKLLVSGETYVLLTLRAENTQTQIEQFHRLQNEVLQAIAGGKSLFSSMDLLCRRVEVMAPEVICTVLLVDEEGRVHPCAAPSLPKVFGEAIDNAPIGPKAGSCGTSAWRGEPVEVTDIATDPLWEDYRALALPLGLAACWSSPIKLRDGRVAGTFALYFRTPRGTSRFHRQMIQACVHLCALAIEHERSQAQIHQLAFYDGLTGLPNASLVRDRAETALSAAQRDGDSVAVLFFDLDHFKTINESLGHDIGDQLLRAVAQRLQQCLQPGDTLSRIGGDEFLLLACECGEAQARMMAGALLESLSKPFAVGDRELSLGASIGISLAPIDALDFETLHKNADMAMYQAKGCGRNTFRFYQAQMNEAAQQRLTLAASLRRALTEGALSVHYQPKIRLDTMCLDGLEALVRWQDPQLGWVSPATFIPLAEEIGLIGAIDLFVMEEACRQIVDWRAGGYQVPAVAVNLSAADFRGEDIFERIEAVLGRTGCPGQLLTLEITESLMLGSVDATLTLMHQLRRLGIALSVDDFGTGFSSLSYLKRFPVSELKLDQSFVADLEDDANDRALAEAVIQLGDSFELRVVAEGVETPEQLEILKAMGCCVVQGFYLARPMSAQALVAWFDGEGRCYLPY